MAREPIRRVVLATGDEMPALGLGTWELGGAGAEHAVGRAIELGYRLIDTACDYGSEAAIASALRSAPSDRDEVYLVSKVEEDEDALEGAKARTAALRVERLDLCLIHRPPPSGAGEALWEGLIEAREEGIARDIGVSNYSIELLERLVEATGQRPAVNQLEWTPFGHSREMADYAARNGIVIQAYSPLTRAERLDDSTLRGVGEKHGKTAAQVLLRWSLETGAAPIPKAGRAEHLEANIDLFDFELCPGEIRTLDELNERWSSLGGLPYV